MSALAVEDRIVRQSSAQKRRAVRSGAKAFGVRAQGPDQKRRPTSPQVHPKRPVARVAKPLAGQVRGCQVSAGRPVCSVQAAAAVRPVRLTDRGIAVVLAVAALVMMAAVLCVGITAFQVMSDPVVAAGIR